MQKKPVFRPQITTSGIGGRDVVPRRCQGMVLLWLEMWLEIDGAAAFNRILTYPDHNPQVLYTGLGGHSYLEGAPLVAASAQIHLKRSAQNNF
eukprot:1160771-Pelagomonas_calceolata.AAC.5